MQFWAEGLSTKASQPYMHHQMQRTDIFDLHFCPYEDFAGIGHSLGVSSLVSKGSVSSFTFEGFFSF